MRGESFTRTAASLRAAGFDAEAERLSSVSLGSPESKTAWEAYARATFLAHAKVYEMSPGKLRFLQYVSKSTEGWWSKQRGRGAVLL